MMGKNQLWGGYRRYRYDGVVVDELSQNVLKEDWSSEINVKDGSNILENITHQFKIRYHIPKKAVLNLPGILTELEMFSWKK